MFNFHFWPCRFLICMFQFISSNNTFLMCFQSSLFILCFSFELKIYLCIIIGSMVEFCFKFITFWKKKILHLFGKITLYLLFIYIKKTKKINLLFVVGVYKFTNRVFMVYQKKNHVFISQLKCHEKCNFFIIYFLFLSFLL